MKWSKFIYKVDVGQVIRLKSSKNEAAFELEKEKYNEIDKMLNEGIKDKVDPYIDHLKSAGMIIDDQEDEKSEFISDISNAIEKIGDEFTVTIIPTLKCNFQCTYCYENGTGRINDMSVGTIDKIFEWIEKELLDRNSIKKINFKLFGGEPLFVKDEILEYLFMKIQNLNIKYTTNIITNGFLLTDKKCEILSKGNMEYLQITLDGPKEFHDSKRPLKSGGSTFDVIINNFARALEKKVSKKYIIRINCCKSNINLIPQLLTYLAERFEQYKHNIVFSLGLLGKSYDDELNKEIDEDYLEIEDGSLDKYVLLYKMIKDLGFPHVDYYAISALCSNKVSDSIIIQADGNVIKCLRGVERKEFYETTIDNMKILDREANINLYSQCFKENCSFIPYCHLGCQYGYYIENKRKRGRYCKREILEYVNKRLLEIMY